MAEIDENEAVIVSEEGRKLGSYLTFSDVSCMLPKKGYILKDVNGHCKPGQALAILGASGAGKSTLLDILSGRKNCGLITGTININGTEMSEYYRRRSGYMTTETVFTSTLTVYEVLSYAALFKMSNSTATHRHERILKVANSLKLVDKLYHRVGDELLRGLSSGERKRLAVAIEMIDDPLMLFMDEPTSGLDSYGAKNSIHVILEYSKAIKSSTVSVIHQPSRSLLEMFDSVLLLSMGRVCFFGPVSELKPFFATQSVVSPVNWNPMDFYMEYIGKNPEKAALAWEQVEVKKKPNARQSIMSYDYSLRKKKTVHERSWFMLVIILMQRNFHRYMRNRTTSLYRFIGGISIALIYGGIFYQLKSDLTGFRLRSVLSGVMGFLPAFMAIQAVPQLIEDRELFYQEWNVGCYSCSAFYLAYFFMEGLWMMGIIILQSIVIYFMAGLEGDLGAYVLMMILQSWLSVAVAQFTTTISRNLVQSFASTTSFCILSYFFSGVSQKIQSMPSYVRWVPDITFWHYTVFSLLKNELFNFKLICIPSNLIRVNYNNITKQVGMALKESIGALMVRSAASDAELLNVEDAFMDITALSMFDAVVVPTLSATLSNASNPDNPIANWLTELPSMSDKVIENAVTGNVFNIITTNATVLQEVAPKVFMYHWWSKRIEAFADAGVLPVKDRCFIEDPKEFFIQNLGGGHSDINYLIAFGFICFYCTLAYLGLRFCNFRKR